jgi:beta-glucosidase
MSQAGYRDSSLSVKDRVKDLLGRMTQEEKLAQVGSVWAPDLLEGERFSDAKAEALLCNGIGHVSRLGTASTLRPAELASTANEIQRYILEKTRLGIPALLHEESCAGLTAREATQFPHAIGLASTWEPDLVQSMADVIREEMVAVGARHTLAPVLDVARDPRWGRCEESFGEDPYLVGRMGVAYVRGIQGASLGHGVAATGKHFLGYGAPEGGMNWAPCQLPRRELLERILPPFEAAVREARIATIMNGYHEIDGIPCGASKELLDDLLRGELGFDGPVVSDYLTVLCLMVFHRITNERTEAAARALEAGLDVELPRLDVFRDLPAAIETGRIDGALLDRAVGRVLRLKIDLGLFESPLVDYGKAPEVFGRQESRELARTIGARSCVLLKNDGLLPLSRGISRIAVLGPNAASVRHLQGGYHYPTHSEPQFGPIYDGDPPADAPEAFSGEFMAGAFDPNLDLRTCLPPTVTVLDGIREAVGPGTEIVHVPGCDIQDPDTGGLDEAAEAAQNVDVAVVVVGCRSGLLKGYSSGEANDSAGLALPGAQADLVRRVVATGTPTAVVLISGRILVLSEIVDGPAAILQVWIPGQEGGLAVADVLFGDVNPAGRLPVTMPRAPGQLPLYYNHKPSGAFSQFHGDYSDLPASPLFCFGHGLSYTRFEYSDLEFSSSEVTTAELLEVSCRVTNVGESAGDEVCQLYVRQPFASLTRPVQELKGFARLEIMPGQSRRVRFALDIRHFAFYDTEMRFVVEPGAVEIMVGASCQDIRLHGEVRIVGECTEVLRADVMPTSVVID